MPKSTPRQNARRRRQCVETGTTTLTTEEEDESTSYSVWQAYTALGIAPSEDMLARPEPDEEDEDRGDEITHEDLRRVKEEIREDVGGRRLKEMLEEKAWNGKLAGYLFFYSCFWESFSFMEF
ncbi:hypothetical protein FN846DRAFT_905494 [Sphaerosporella brunnea]|uniref:Uncharacterized protein n=1 Tax=Sphaerosporella brunnea TaxID=1250544 RepID=A0A5J5F1G9_9PEZI|nr:hypothetical protein FN846DRAFT_905494 [Sphaerosporella brunnea]